MGMVVALVAALILLRMTGVLSPESLVETQVVFSLKWGLAIAFFLQMPFAWRSHRRYTLTEASLRSLPEPGSAGLPAQVQALDKEGLIRWAVLQGTRRRSARMLGELAGALGMLAGLYVITKADWLLLVMLVYAAGAAWVFRPKDQELIAAE
jgi:hypothetical protein